MLFLQLLCLYIPPPKECSQPYYPWDLVPLHNQRVLKERLKPNRTSSQPLNLHQTHIGKRQ